MINRFALSFLCIELDREKICEVMLLYIAISLGSMYSSTLTTAEYSTLLEAN